MGINQFTAYSEQEFKERFLGEISKQKSISLIED